MKIIMFAFLIFFSLVVFAVQSYEIEKSVNDEYFIINGETFKAKTTCFNMDEGDDVIFIEGSAYGACASAKLYNVDSEKTCEVWCE